MKCFHVSQTILIKLYVQHMGYYYQIFLFNFFSAHVRSSNRIFIIWFLSSISFYWINQYRKTAITSSLHIYVYRNGRTGKHVDNVRRKGSSGRGLTDCAMFLHFSLSLFFMIFSFPFSFRFVSFLFDLLLFSYFVDLWLWRCGNDENIKRHKERKEDTPEEVLVMYDTALLLMQ